MVFLLKQEKKIHFSRCFNFLPDQPIIWLFSRDKYTSDCLSEYVGCYDFSGHENHLKRCRKITRSAWNDVKLPETEKTPYDIYDFCFFKPNDANRNKLLEKLRDGRLWKNDSRTNWSGYESVWYRDFKERNFSYNTKYLITSIFLKTILVILSGW